MSSSSSSEKVRPKVDQESSLNPEKLKFSILSCYSHFGMTDLQMLKLWLHSFTSNNTLKVFVQSCMLVPRPNRMEVDRFTTNLSKLQVNDLKELLEVFQFVKTNHIQDNR
jgi:hypothetical protein